MGGEDSWRHRRANGSALDPLTEAVRVPSLKHEKWYQGGVVHKHKHIGIPWRDSMRG